MKGYLKRIDEMMMSLGRVGMCLGDELMGVGVGGDSYKVGFGEGGGNDGVQDREWKGVLMRSENERW